MSGQIQVDALYSALSLVGFFAEIRGHQSQACHCDTAIGWACRCCQQVVVPDHFRDVEYAGLTQGILLLGDPHSIREGLHVRPIGCRAFGLHLLYFAAVAADLHSVLLSPDQLA